MTAEPKLLISWLEFNISEPNIVSMVLQGDISGFKFSKYIRVIGKFAVIHHLLPCGSSKVIFNNRLTILEMDNCAPVDKHLCFVPFTVTSEILRVCRNKVVEASGLSVSVFTKQGVWMVCIVQDLHLRS